LFVGFIWAFASEILDKGFRGREEIEEFTGVPALGIVPRVKSLASGKKSAVAYIKDNPQSAYAESIRTLHSGILIAAGQIIPRTILVTSSQSGEGKTTTAVSLAEILALDNRRVAIVDADNRRPAVHSAYEVPVEPGLTGLLSGAIRLSDLVSTDRAEPGPVVIPAGKTVANAQSLFASAEMRNLLKKMEKEFDHIIIDSPPIMAVSDALILASRVESSVFVARWGYTSREAVKHGLQQLHKAGGKLAGVLLSMVDVKQYARYAYGDSGSYVGRLAHYYAHDTSESPRRSASTASQQPPG
ncbi:MAG: CpsD/CapB family tyrosine-protein kinase, partial [Gammaproteobacteria bacterium]|nr:CpsD/CapB family tyrosine-protein kinase [Gammaproteobacteria bacterium]